MRLALVVDSPKRDLDGLVLVAYQLARRGTEVFLVPMYQQGYDVPVLRPDAVVVNYARENNLELLTTYKRLAIAVLVLDTEGGVLSESGLDAPYNWAKQFHALGLHHCVDRYLFWGPRLYEAFAAASGMSPPTLSVTGCPRYDFCAYPWRRLLEFAERDYVLVNTNFSAVNPRFTQSAHAEKAIFVQLGWPTDYVDRLFTDLERVFPRYLEAIEHVARRQPRLRIRVRPHPFEDAALYERRFAGITNIVVEGGGNVLPVIASAACVVHLNCGTAVESLMLGTPAVSLEFLNTEAMRAHAPLPSTLSVPAQSAAEFEHLVVNSDELRRRLSNTGPDLLSRFVEPWFHQVDGHSAERVAENAIAAARSRGSPRYSLLASLRGSRTTSLGRLATGFASNLLGSAAASSLQGVTIPARRAKRVLLGEVRQLINRICSLDAQPALCVEPARHPVSRMPMASIRISTS